VRQRARGGGNYVLGARGGRQQVRCNQPARKIKDNHRYKIRPNWREGEENGESTQMTKKEQDWLKGGRFEFEREADLT